FPTFLRIREVSKRVIEFVLDLDAQQIRVQKRELEQKAREISQKWKDIRGQVERVARSSNATIQGIPAAPDPEFAREQPVEILLLRKNEWRSLDEVVREQKERLAVLAQQATPTTMEVSSQLQDELKELRGSLEELSAEREAVFAQLM